jgi:hypothetical protein
VDQGDQVAGALAGRRGARPQPQAGDQIELAPLALRRGQEQLLVEPVDVGEVEPPRQVG